MKEEHKLAIIIKLTISVLLLISLNGCGGEIVVPPVGQQKIEVISCEYNNLDQIIPCNEFYQQMQTELQLPDLKQLSCNENQTFWQDQLTKDRPILLLGGTQLVCNYRFDFAGGQGNIYFQGESVPIRDLDKRDVKFQIAPVQVVNLYLRWQTPPTSANLNVTYQLSNSVKQYVYFNYQTKLADYKGQ